jgi:hypothetical protein
VSVLRSELGVEPEPETRQLYQAILQQRATPHAAPAGRRPCVPKVPETRPAETPLIGRDADVAQLREALDGAAGGRRRPARHCRGSRSGEAAQHPPPSAREHPEHLDSGSDGGHARRSWTR